MPFGYFNRAICFSMNSCVSIKICRLYRKVSGSSISVTLIVYELINARAFSKADAMVGAIVSSFFRKNKSNRLVADSQPAMISDSRSSSPLKR